MVVIPTVAYHRLLKIVNADDINCAHQYMPPIRTATHSINQKITVDRSRSKLVAFRTIMLHCAHIQTV